MKVRDFPARRRRPARRSRCGQALFEGMIAMLLVGAMALGVGQLAVLAARQQQAAATRRAALDAAANALEVLRAGGRLPDSGASLAAPAELLARAPDAALSLERHPLAEPLAGERLTVVVEWSRGGAEQRVALSDWRLAAPPPGATP